MWMRFAAWSCTAFTTSGWQWPVETVEMPAAKSRKRLPSTSSTTMPWARATTRGTSLLRFCDTVLASRAMNSLARGPGRGVTIFGQSPGESGGNGERATLFLLSRRGCPAARQSFSPAARALSRTGPPAFAPSPARCYNARRLAETSLPAGLPAARARQLRRKRAPQHRAHHHRYGPRRPFSVRRLRAADGAEPPGDRERGSRVHPGLLARALDGAGARQPVHRAVPLAAQDRLRLAAPPRRGGDPCRDAACGGLPHRRPYGQPVAGERVQFSAGIRHVRRDLARGPAGGGRHRGRTHQREGPALSALARRQP